MAAQDAEHPPTAESGRFALKVEERHDLESRSRIWRWASARRLWYGPRAWPASAEDKQISIAFVSGPLNDSFFPAALPGRAGRGQGARRQAQLHPDRRGRHRGDLGAHDAGGDRAEARRHRRRRFRHQRRRSLHQAGGRGRHSRLCQPVRTGPVAGRRRLRLRRPAGPGGRPGRRRASGQGGLEEHPVRHQRAGQSLSAGDLQGPRREGQGARRERRPISNCRPPTRPTRPRSAATSAPICSRTRTSTASSPRTPRSAPPRPPRSTPRSSPARSMSARWRFRGSRCSRSRTARSSS